MSFLLNIGFPVDLPAVFVVPPPYSPLWFPVVDGVCLDWGFVKALVLAVVGTGLGLLLMRRQVRVLFWCSLPLSSDISSSWLKCIQVITS